MAVHHRVQHDYLYNRMIPFMVFISFFLHPVISYAQAPFGTEILSVSEVLLDANSDGELDNLGETVTVSGRSNSESFTLYNQLLSVYIQDKEAGVLLFSSTNKQNVVVGDSVIARGELRLYYGKPEINIDTLIIVDSEPIPPASVPLTTVVQDPEQYIGMLTSGRVVVAKKSASSGYRGLTVSVRDSLDNEVEVYISQAHKHKDDFNFEMFSIGDEIELRGIFGKFVFDNGRQVYQVLPRTPDDLRPAGLPRRFYRIAVWISIISILIVAVWIYSLKKRVNAQTRELSKALEEKEILMQEIHHRVKNNLAKISALLDFQINSTNDQAVEESLTNSKSRINSMVLIHDKLYQSQEYQLVRLDTYLRELITAIHDTYNQESNDVELVFDLSPVEVTVDRAVICGLLVNELIVNAFKYAFSYHKNGILEVTLKKTNQQMMLSISDNGPGLSDKFENLIGQGLGSVLIQSFAEQLNAEMEVTSGTKGTTFTFRCD